MPVVHRPTSVRLAPLGIGLVAHVEVRNRKNRAVRGGARCTVGTIVATAVVRGTERAIVGKDGVVC